MNAESRAAGAWLGSCVALGGALVALYPGSYYQDPLIHYLRARWMWAHPWMLVDLWDRPVFTLLYSLPAALPIPGGLAYTAAKLCTLALWGVAAWLTWRLAREYQLERPALAVPLLFLQPCVFLLSGETSPEALFALLFVAALRLHLRGRVVGGLALVSLLMLVEPEGMALGALWAWWVVKDRRAGLTLPARCAHVLWLAVAPAVWWYLSAQITQDPLFIVHDWPPLRVPLSALFTGRTFDDSVRRWTEIVGFVLAVPFVVGVARSAWRRHLGLVLAALLMFVAVHLAAGGTGLFGWAPAPSAFAAVAPAIALITLAGWNLLARQFAAFFPGYPTSRGVVAAGVLTVSACADLLYADAQPASRDWRAIAEETTWFGSHPRPVRWLIWSHAYADVLFGHDPTESALTYGNPSRTLLTLRNAAPGTLVLWDGQVGPPFYGVRGGDIERAGYVKLRRSAYRLRGWIPGSVTALPGVAQLRALQGVSGGDDSVRVQEIWLLYRQ